jgi:hypothetical protein
MTNPRDIACAIEWLLEPSQAWPYALPFQPAGPFAPASRRSQLSHRLFISGDHRDLASLQGAMSSGRRAALEVAAALA